MWSYNQIVELLLVRRRTPKMRQNNQEAVLTVVLLMRLFVFSILIVGGSTAADRAIAGQISQNVLSGKKTKNISTFLIQKSHVTPKAVLFYNWWFDVIKYYLEDHKTKYFSISFLGFKKYRLKTRRN